MSKLILPVVAIGLVLSLFSCQKEEVSKSTTKVSKTTELSNFDIRAILKEQGVKLKADAFSKAEDVPPTKVFLGKWTASAPYPNKKVKCMAYDRICYFIIDLSMIEDDGGATKYFEDDDYMVLMGDDFNYGFYGKVIGQQTGIGYTEYTLR